MSANKKTNKTDTELTGKVVMKKFGKGSKSEHNAVCLQTNGGEYLLRRVGGNPFYDEMLHGMVGKEIKASGMLSDSIFFAKTVQEI